MGQPAKKMLPHRQCHHCKEWIPRGEAHNCWTTTEATLTKDLTKDLRDAWERIRETADEFGEQRICSGTKRCHSRSGDSRHRRESRRKWTGAISVR
jgi:hypothetical protein